MPGTPTDRRLGALGTCLVGGMPVPSPAPSAAAVALDGDVVAVGLVGDVGEVTGA